MRPWAAIEAATVRSFTTQPASIRSACTLGDPYVPSEASKNSFTFVSSSARRS